MFPPVNAAAPPVQFLLKLVDDESPVVQEEVRKALLSVTDQLEGELTRWEATDSQRAATQQLLRGYRKARLLARWPAWQRLEAPAVALEEAHGALCEYGTGWLYPEGLGATLDRLAQEVGPTPWRELPARLFAERLQGQREDYYHPHNSFLTSVLNCGAGNPISLCTLLILVGRRLDHPFWGCNYPGHFLARHENGEGLHLVDCFRGGALLGPALVPELRGELTAAQAASLTAIPATLAQMVSRVLRNLVGAYLRQEQQEEANLFFFLLKDLSARDKGRGGGAALREPLYHPGQLVAHKSKDNRGVVVDYELYSAGQDGLTHEPEYRILVDKSPQVSTWRESALCADPSKNLVAHPFVPYYFTKFADGLYLRNSRPWEG